MDLKEASLRPDLSRRHPWELARLEVVRRILRKSAPSLETPGSVVLDVGCGDAFVAWKLAADHPRARFLAVDTAFTDPMLRRLARECPFPNLQFHRSLESVGLPPGSVNVVLVLDVLEHVPDDASFLSALARSPLLSAQAVFLITAPAFQALFLAHDHFLGHFRRYNLSGLARLARRARMKVGDRGYFFVSLLAPRLLQRLAQSRLRRPPPEPGTAVSRWKGGPRLTRLLTRALLCDVLLCRAARRLGVLLPGLSCYALCQTQPS